MNPTLAQEFIHQSLKYFNENTPRIEKCLKQLTEEQIWQRPNTSSNSIGNLILHLCGNITQYILSGLGSLPDQRKRALEFSLEGGFSKEELLNKISSTVKEASEIIKNLTVDELMEERVVQGFNKTGVGIVIHVVEHYSYHTGQIAFWTKLLLDKDLGFYAGINLNITN